jgi:hypothetical protein
MKMDQLASRPDIRPANELRPGWDLVPPDNFGRPTGNSIEILGN